jgi:hypothetical protein
VGTATFLRMEGSKTRGIVFAANHLSGAEHPTSATKDVSPNAVGVTQVADRLI